jgi:hypothetical protein
MCLDQAYFPIHPKCGFKWKTQAIRAEACLDEESFSLPPPTPQAWELSFCKGKHVITFISQAWEAWLSLLPSSQLGHADLGSTTRGFFSQKFGEGGG